MDADRISKILDEELGKICQPELIDTIKNHLVTPRLEDRDWDYGDPGQTYPCWIVLEDNESDTVVAYCESGFGPKDPWGLMSLSKFRNIGMDSGWFTSLEDAVRESTFWLGENPMGYEVE